MGPTWRDLVSTIAMIAIVFVYAGNRSGGGLPLVSDIRAASAVALILAAVCAWAAAWDLHTRPQQGWGVVIRRFTTVTGAIALVAGLTGLLAGTGHALEFLVVAVLLLWLAATCWHLIHLGGDEEP
jgi:hypothetical protein